MSSGGFDSPASGLCAIFLRFVVGSGSVLTRGGRRIVNTCELKLEIMSIGEKAAGGALSYNTLVPGFISPPPSTSLMSASQACTLCGPHSLD